MIVRHPDGSFSYKQASRNEDGAETLRRKRIFPGELGYAEILEYVENDPNDVIDYEDAIR